MRGDGPICRNYILAIFLGQLAAHVSMKRKIKRAKLLPNAVKFPREIIGSHVVLGTPERADVGITKLAGACLPHLPHSPLTTPHRLPHHGPSDHAPQQLS